ncbi:MAG: S-adenosylmethionine:tRNA ribosyltransferase-isomerase, partial [Thermomicrobiaceae bacterium]
MSEGRHEKSSLPISLFDYDLPPELIAQSPLDKRSSSRMLVLQRETGEITHSMFADIPEWLRSGDLLVLNDTRVFPARLYAIRGTGGKIDILLLRQIDGDRWQAMARPARKLRQGEKLTIVDRRG